MFPEIFLTFIRALIGPLEDGYLYEGQFVNGQFSGRGRFVHTDGAAEDYSVPVVARLLT